jgi:hypothetical protein
LGCCGVVPYMDPINEAHVSELGLVVIDVAGADDATVLVVHAALAARWATASADRTTCDADQPGVQLRCAVGGAAGAVRAGVACRVGWSLVAWM